MFRLPKIINKTLSVRLSLIVVSAMAILLMATLTVMLYYSKKALKEEALEKVSQTLEGTVQSIDNILLSVEQTTGNIYFNLMPHLDQPDMMFTYSRQIVEANKYVSGCAIAFRENFYQGRDLFMPYFRRENIGGRDTVIQAETFANGPYTEQAWYKRYTGKSTEADGSQMIDPTHSWVVSNANSLWDKSGGDVIEYARLCYEFVAESFTYGIYDGDNSVNAIIGRMSGDCGNQHAISYLKISAPVIRIAHHVLYKFIQFFNQRLQTSRSDQFRMFNETVKPDIINDEISGWIQIPFKSFKQLLIMCLGAIQKDDIKLFISLKFPGIGQYRVYPVG